MGDTEADELVDVDDDDDDENDFDDQVASAYGKHMDGGGVGVGGAWTRPKSASRLRPRPNSASPKGGNGQSPPTRASDTGQDYAVKGVGGNGGGGGDASQLPSKGRDVNRNAKREHRMGDERKTRPASAEAVSISKNRANVVQGRIRPAFSAKAVSSLRPQSAYAGTMNLKNGSNAMSADFLKKRNARKKADDLQFERMCRMEEQRFEATCLEKIIEANDMARIMKLTKSYQAVRCQTSQGHRDFKVQIADSSNAENTLTVTSQFFLREFQKLKTQFSSFEGRPNHGGGGGAMANTGRDRSRTASSSTPTVRDDTNGHLHQQHHHSSHAPQVAQPYAQSTLLRAKPSRKETQDELRAVLSDTVRLTGILQEQLDELKRRGWNKVNM